MSSKKPRFFCDNCNAEVGANAEKCPGCGRYFASVRCPACAFSGEEAFFRNGCPACGYSKPREAVRSRRIIPRNKNIIQALPLWVYIITAVALIAVLVGFLYRFF